MADYYLQSNALGDKAIHVINSNGDPNNPKAYLQNDKGENLFLVTEHLNPAGYNALSHEVKTLKDYDVEMWGDHQGRTFVNGGVCNGAHPGGNVGHWVEAADYTTQAAYRSMNDIFSGAGGHDELHGLTGNDTLNGGAGEDSLFGGVGKDSLSGGVGNDLLEGEDGTDILNGDAGDDSLSGGSDNDSLYGGAGNDTLNGGDGDDYLNGGDGHDAFIGSAGSDQIWGSEGSSSNYETVNYGGMQVTLEYTQSSINGSPIIQAFKANGGVDTLMFIDDVIGSNVQRNYVGNGSNNVIFGDDYSNAVFGFAGDDVLHGGAGNDTIEGGEGQDLLYGDDHNDIVMGGAGNDSVYGGAGNDLLHGGDGTDYINGETGADTLEGGAGADTMISTDGSDVGLYANSLTSAIVQLTDETNADGLFIGYGYGTTDAPNLESAGDMFYGFHAIEGSTFADEIVGNSQNNVFAGNAGDDFVQGNAGNDTIYGGAGADTLRGDSGVDHLFGNDGSDVYVYMPGSGYDYIYEDAAGTGTDIAYTVGISQFDAFKEGNHLFLATNGNVDDLIIFADWYVNQSVEFLQAEWEGSLYQYTLQQFADVATDITPTSAYANFALQNGAESEVSYGDVIPLIAENMGSQSMILA